MPVIQHLGGGTGGLKSLTLGKDASFPKLSSFVLMFEMFSPDEGQTCQQPFHLWLLGAGSQACTHRRALTGTLTGLHSQASTTKLSQMPSSA